MDTFLHLQELPSTVLTQIGQNLISSSRCSSDGLSVGFKDLLNLRATCRFLNDLLCESRIYFHLSIGGKNYFLHRGKLFRTFLDYLKERTNWKVARLDLKFCQNESKDISDLLVFLENYKKLFRGSLRVLNCRMESEWRQLNFALFVLYSVDALTVDTEVEIAANYVDLKQLEGFKTVSRAASIIRKLELEESVDEVKLSVLRSYFPNLELKKNII